MADGRSEATTGQEADDDGKGMQSEPPGVPVRDGTDEDAPEQQGRDAEAGRWEECAAETGEAAPVRTRQHENPVRIGVYRHR